MRALAGGVRNACPSITSMSRLKQNKMEGDSIPEQCSERRDRVRWVGERIRRGQGGRRGDEGL